MGKPDTQKSPPPGRVITKKELNWMIRTRILAVADSNKEYGYAYL